MFLARAALVIAMALTGTAVGPVNPAGATRTGAGTAQTGTAQTGTAGAGLAPWAGEAAATMTTGYVVFDRTTGRFTRVRLATKQFRSASVVKLLIALDHLWTRDPGDMTARNRRRMETMLSSSNDANASYFWGRNGSRRVILRMAKRLELRNTAPPPRRLRGWWGYTAMTAGDTVRIYRYLLADARPAVRTFVMRRLHLARDRGSDGANQRFGLLTLPAPRAAKQGWSGFGGGPPAGARIRGLDLRAEALHTTGTAGARDRYVVAVFTLHPRGTRYGTATARVTRLTRSLLP